MHRVLTTLALVGLPLAPPAMAHPHVFVDAGVDFLFEADHLAAVRITWVYDEFTSLYLFDVLSLDPDKDGELTDADRAAIVRGETEWDPGYEGDSYLSIEGAPMKLSRPRNASADMVDGRIKVVFERALDIPQPAADLVASVKLYDPIYYYAYTTDKPVELDGAPEDCRSETVLFTPDGETGPILEKLAALSREEVPEDDTVGALFADEVRLICG